MTTNNTPLEPTGTKPTEISLRDREAAILARRKRGEELARKMEENND